MRLTAELLAATDPPLSQRVLIAVLGPLVTALLGTGLIGWILKRGDLRTERDREAREDQQKESERARTRDELENQIRHELLTPLLTAAAKLYLATQHYGRIKEGEIEAAQDPKEDLGRLTAQYQDSRATITVLEAKLQALFVSDHPAVLCHRIDDLLTVRYMQLIGRGTPGLYRQNSRGYHGMEHSGLTSSELSSEYTILRTYHAAMKEVAPIILSSAFRRQAEMPRRQ